MKWLGWLLLLLVAFPFVMDALEPPTKYRAEVGYHEGSEERWYFGSDTTRDQCTKEATAKYDWINHKTPGRAWWACLRVSADGNRILGRVR